MKNILLSSVLISGLFFGSFGVTWQKLIWFIITIKVKIINNFFMLFLFDFLVPLCAGFSFV
jgi:hypothetical protein